MGLMIQGWAACCGAELDVMATGKGAWGRAGCRGAQAGAPGDGMATDRGAAKGVWQGSLHGAGPSTCTAALR